MNSLLGTIRSLRSQLVMVVARIWMRETTPVTSPIVTTSPMRMGRSNNRIRPETKLAKISWSPNPRPTLTAAISHWTLDQPIPRAANASTTPTTVIA